MADGWAYARCYLSEQERRDGLADWLHHYNQHRPHTACGGRPPFSRLINVPEQYKLPIPTTLVSSSPNFSTLPP